MTLIPSPVIEAVQRCRHLYVLTGAGISAESGIATFRDQIDGLWSRFDPVSLAVPAAFRRDPALVWGWYEWRRRQILTASPNSAHIALAELTSRVPQCTLVTQNVDDLHERAGSSGVIHLHGSLFKPRCFACARPYEDDLEELPGLDRDGRIEPPRCKRCNGKIRPGVVWFGEALPQPEARIAVRAARDCDCLLSIGTSGEVEPAASIPAQALQSGAVVIHINIDPPRATSPNEYALQGKAGEVLPSLLRRSFPNS